MGKISKKLKKYPLSIYGNTKENEIYKMGFQRAIEIVKKYEKKTIWKLKKQKTLQSTR